MVLSILLFVGGIGYVALADLLIGSAMPFAAAIVIQSKWSKRTQSILVFAMATAASIVTAWIQGSLNFQDLAGTFTLIYTATIVAYHGLWKPTGAAPKVEEVTSA